MPNGKNMSTIYNPIIKFPRSHFPSHLRNHPQFPNKCCELSRRTGRPYELACAIATPGGALQPSSNFIPIPYDIRPGKPPYRGSLRYPVNIGQLAKRLGN